MSASTPSETSEKPSHRRFWRRSLLVEVLVVIGIYALISAWRGQDALPTGEAAPVFELSALDGGKVSLAQFKGRPVLLHFWATWCSACRLELSSLNSLSQNLPADAVLLSVVADADDPEQVRRFVRERGIRYPVALADASLLRQFGVSAFPTNYYIDREGRISDVTVGVSLRWMMWLRLKMAS
jgi:peroxiredoxin